MSKYFGNSGKISRIVLVNKGHLSHESKAKFSKSSRPVFTKIVFVTPQSIYPKIKFLLQFQPNRQTTYHKILKYIETMLHMIQDVYKLYCTEWHGLGYQTK